MKTIVRFGIISLIVAKLAPRMMAQVAATPDPGARQDSVIIFSTPRPLIETEEPLSERRNSW